MCDTATDNTNTVYNVRAIQDDTNTVYNVPSQETTNVLCLHGYGQDQVIFKRKLRDYLKRETSHHLCFHFLDAEYEICEYKLVMKNGACSTTETYQSRTWFNEVVDTDKVGCVKYDPKVAEEPCQRVIEYIRNNSITALLGFSQGAILIDTLMRHHHVPEIKACLLFCGCSYWSPTQVDTSDPTKIVRDPLQTVVPTLHVVSKDDTVVPFQLAPNDGNTIVHVKDSGKHNVCTVKSKIWHYCDFLSSGDLNKLSPIL